MGTSWPAGRAHLGWQSQDTHTSHIPRAHTQSQRHADIHVSAPETQTPRLWRSPLGPLGTSRQDGEGQGLGLLEESPLVRARVSLRDCMAGGRPARVT